MDQQAFRFRNQGAPLFVRDWIKSIADGTVPDALTTFDTAVDSSIGGFKTALEYVLGTTRPVPIFEFRKLDNIETPETVSFAKRVEEIVLYLHKTFREAM